MGCGGFDHSFHRRLAGHIRLDRYRLAALLPDHRHGFFRGIQAHIRHGYFRPVSGEHNRSGPADAVAATGD